jgi:NADH:ubiquinone oxidoreductase subunit 6 (subunit J)
MMNILNSSLVLLNSSKPVMATIALAFSFLNTSFVLIVMNFEFIALIIIIVYIGAIIILFLFTIMLLHIKDDIYLTGQNESAMLYFTFSFLYYFYFIVIMIITEGENLEDSFINTTINLTNSISIDNLLNQTISTVQESEFYVENYSNQNLSSTLIYRDMLNTSECRLISSNLNNLFEFYEVYELFSRDPVLCPREIVYYCPLYPGLYGQAYFSFLDMPREDINTCLAYSLQDYRQFFWATNSGNYKKYYFTTWCNAGDFVRTDSVFAAMRFILYLREALENGLLETYNLSNPSRYELFPQEDYLIKEDLGWVRNHFPQLKIREYQMQVAFGGFEAFHIGYGMDYGQKFYDKNDLIVQPNSISDFLTNLTFLNEQSLVSEPLTMRSCNKDLELETELQSLGIVLYTIGCVYFILASIILLIALIGSVVLITSDSTEFIEIQQTSNQISKKCPFFLSVFY